MPLPPGLEGYVLADQQRQAQGTNALAQMSSMLQIQQSQRQAASQNALMGVMKNLPKKADGSFDMQAAVPQLLQAGPAGLEAVNHLVKVNESLNNQRMMEQFNGGGGTPGQPPSPEVLDMLALKAGIGGHPGAATLSRVADARRVQQQNVQAVDAMKSAPGVTPATPNDDQGNPMPVIPAKPGIFAALAGSKYPEVSQSAQALQQQIDQGAPGMTPQQINAHADRLTSLNSSRASTDAVQAALTARNKENQQIRIDLHNTPRPNVGGDASGDLTKEAIHDLAVQSLYNPQVLVGFNRDTRTRKLIQNEATRVSQESGATPNDIVSGRAGFKADSTSLNKLVPQYDAVTAFEKTAIRNGDRLIKLADKVDSTGIPVIEKWIRAGRQATGDADVSTFNTQMQVYGTEAARILTNPNLSGQLTDNARREVREFLSGNASAKQIKEVVNLLKTDFEARKATLEEQIGAIRERMKGRMVGPESEQPAAPAPQRRASDKAPASSGWSVKVIQ